MDLMASITPSDAAPKGKVHYSLAGVEFDLDSKGKFETDDPDVISNAEASPFLTVTADAGSSEPFFIGGQVDPKDDPLSAESSVAFDPEAVAAARKEREDSLYTPVVPTYEAPEQEPAQGTTEPKIVVTEQGDVPTPESGTKEKK